MHETLHHQPLNSHIISQVKPVQTTIQLGLWAAADNVALCWLFTTRMQGSTFSCRMCSVTLVSLEAIYYWPAYT